MSLTAAKVPFLDLTGQYAQIKSEVLQAVEGVFASQQFVLNKNVEALEKKMAFLNGAKHAIGLASGTDALYLALMAAGVGPGDEVITTPFTFFATVASITRLGAKPVFVDIRRDTFNLNEDLIEKAITKKTKVILPVHLFGLMADMDKISVLARKHKLVVIEDAAQAYGAEFRGKRAGSIADMGCLSFFPTKNLGGAGDGGMLFTSDDELAARVRVLRVHGSKQKYVHEWVGLNSRLDELQAAVLLVKLKYIDSWNEKRRSIAKHYSEHLKNSGLILPAEPAGHKHVYHLYSILSDKRDQLAKHLEENQIGAGVYYPVPMHLQPCFAYLGVQKGNLPITEEICAKVLSLPMYPELNDSHIQSVLSATRQFFG